ncbi:MAG TPA: FAD-dependent oxidoreductase [Thermodesulfobacteriota bacterium]|nr:FAD-dependent oxidoreductase [Thermodesulfobacteriota bacterium]
MTPKRIVIVGSNFAGFTAAMELAKRLNGRHKIVVISRSDKFVFIPSLIWVPFGKRKEENISFPLAPIYKKKGIQFIHAEALRFDLNQHVVETTDGDISYDYLLIATGPKPDYDMISGLGPEHGHTVSICTLEHAEGAAKAWEQLLLDPGPVVIGATQGAACFGASYEFLLNVRYQLAKNGLEKSCPITFVTAEPFLGHFGIGGFGKAQEMVEGFFKKLGIKAITNAAIEQVGPDTIHLGDGQKLPFKFAMLIPRFLGVDAVRNSPGLGNASGFIEVDDAYRMPAHPEIYAAGVAVAVKPPGPTPVPIGVPKTGYNSEEMARVAAHNIASAIEGGSEIRLPFSAMDAKCILDAGSTGIIMLSDRILAPRKHQWLIPGPEAHWAKVAFEKYFLATRRRGRV